MNCVWTLVHLHYTSHTFQGNRQSLQWNVFAHVNNFFSNLIECVASVIWVWRYCRLVYKFSRINNMELKCSFVWFVRCLKYHKSWWSGAAELQIAVDLLCGTTFAELHNSVDLLSAGTTAVELHSSVDLLRGTTAAELNNPVSLMHAPAVAHIFKRQLWKIQ